MYRNGGIFLKAIGPLLVVPCESLQEMDDPGDWFDIKIGVDELCYSLENSRILYSENYSRGLKKAKGANQSPNKNSKEMFLPITDSRVQITQKKAMEMAVEKLRNTFYIFNLVWNARPDPRVPPPQFNKKEGTLSIYGSLTIPDSAHRHYSLFLINKWKNDPHSIPNKGVKVKGVTVSKKEIIDLVHAFNLEHKVKVHLLTLDAEEEGKLFYQWNQGNTKANASRAANVNRDADPRTRFVFSLLQKSNVLTEHEIELNSTSLGGNSSKLVPVSTLISACDKHMEELANYEKEIGIYKNLIQFFVAFLDELSVQYPALKPNASVESRKMLREQNFILSNVMFHPLFKIAFEFFGKYHENRKKWQTDDAWKKFLSHVAQAENELETGEVVKAMSRKNPFWEGTIGKSVVKSDGTLSWHFNNKWSAKDEAYRYLCEIGGMATISKSKIVPFSNSNKTFA